MQVLNLKSKKRKNEEKSDGCLKGNHHNKA